MFLTFKFFALVEILIYNCCCVFDDAMQEHNSSRQKVRLEMKTVGACVTYIAFNFLMMS